jgi:hypothetical protein
MIRQTNFTLFIYGEDNARCKYLCRYIDKSYFILEIISIVTRMLFDNFLKIASYTDDTASLGLEYSAFFAKYGNLNATSRFRNNLMESISKHPVRICLALKVF